MTFRLIIGNKNYSSWSMRPWFAMTVAGIPFDETVISLDAPDFKSRVLAASPAGKVPVLIDGDVHVWESLAILEYLAEAVPAAKLLPANAQARAHARAISAEMHAGFLPLRRACPMNFWRPVTARDYPGDVLANVARIDAMWCACRARHGSGGPFLFGHFTAADAMYAPVVSRFHSYGLSVTAPARAYMRTIMGLPAWEAWRQAALKESWVLPNNEPDWPDVPRQS